jgi:hypothetical protein
MLGQQFRQMLIITTSVACVRQEDDLLPELGRDGVRGNTPPVPVDHGRHTVLTVGSQ